MLRAVIATLTLPLLLEAAAASEYIEVQGSHLEITNHAAEIFLEVCERGPGDEFDPACVTAGISCGADDLDWSEGMPFEVWAIYEDFGKLDIMEYVSDSLAADRPGFEVLFRSEGGLAAVLRFTRAEIGSTTNTGPDPFISLTGADPSALFALYEGGNREITMALGGQDYDLTAGQDSGDDLAELMRICTAMHRNMEMTDDPELEEPHVVDVEPVDPPQEESDGGGGGWLYGHSR